MTNFLETGFDLPPYLDGRYDLTPYLKQSLVAAIPDTSAGTGGAQSPARRRGIRRHRANERRLRMAELYAGPKLLILPGVRVRVHLRRLRRSQRAIRSGTGAWLGTDPLGAQRQLRHRAAGRARAVCGDARTPTSASRSTRSLARPNYYDIVPYRAQDDNAATISLGNADLSADDVVERRRARRALLHVGWRRVGRRVLQEHLRTTSSTSARRKPSTARSIR